MTRIFYHRLITAYSWLCELHAIFGNDAFAFFLRNSFKIGTADKDTHFYILAYEIVLTWLGKNRKFVIRKLRFRRNIVILSSCYLLIKESPISSFADTFSINVDIFF